MFIDHHQRARVSCKIRRLVNARRHSVDLFIGRSVDRQSVNRFFSLFFAIPRNNRHAPLFYRRGMPPCSPIITRYALNAVPARQELLIETGQIEASAFLNVKIIGGDRVVNAGPWRLAPFFTIDRPATYTTYQ